MKPSPSKRFQTSEPGDVSRSRSNIRGGPLKSKKSSARLSKTSRISLRSIDESYDYDQSKCHCTHCKLRNRHKSLREETNRMQANIFPVIEAVGEQIESALSDLDELVKFKSISVDSKYLLDCCKALEWMANRLSKFNFKNHFYPINEQGKRCFEVHQQKVLFSSYFCSPTKCTLLIYMHLDVLPVDIDCWLNDPFELHSHNDCLYGRGVSSGKGMAICWLQAFESWLKIHDCLPMNIKIVVDMLREVGSEGLQQYLKAKNDFFVDVDFMAFNVNSWLNQERPVVPCSLSGWAHFGLQVRGANKDLEGGLASGLVFEPMIDLCHLMNRLLNNRQEIAIPYTDSHVKKLTVQEWHLLETADFSTHKYKEELYIRRVKHDQSKVDLLQSRWCSPTLTMHGVEGCDSRPGCNRIMPMRVLGKFSIKLVPDQDVFQIQSVVREYVGKLSRELHLGTHVSVHLLDSCEPKAWSPDSKLNRSMKRAVEIVYQKEPVFTVGISISFPIASVFKKLLNKPVVLVPYSMRIDRHHQENESIKEQCFLKHSQLCAYLMYELCLFHVKCKCDQIYEYCNLVGALEKLQGEPLETVVEKPKKGILHLGLKRKPPVDGIPQKRTEVKRTNALKSILCPPFKWKKTKKTEPAKL